MTEQVSVSILCLTYNQKDYVKQALDGFLMQKTDFAFEVLINDDCSTDGTIEILQSYARKHPDIFKLNIQSENQYSKGVRNMIPRFLLPKARGKYLAVCEGDDYWTDDKKLQTQFDYMEANPATAICFHPVRVMYENGEKPPSTFPEKRDGKYTIRRLLKENYMHTNSVMYRKQKYEALNLTVMPGDWYLHLYHAQFGAIGYVDKVMGVYRKHPGGIWWNRFDDSGEFWLKYATPHLAMYNELMKMYGHDPQYRARIATLMRDVIGSLLIMKTDPEIKNEKLEQAIAQAPGGAVQLLHEQYAELDDRAYIIHHQKNEVRSLKQLVRHYEDTLRTIKASRLWKARNVAARAAGKKEV